MPERLRVLYLPKADPTFPFAPIGSDLVDAIGSGHDLLKTQNTLEA
jgi:hypothetical protein